MAKEPAPTLRSRAPFKDRPFLFGIPHSVIPENDRRGGLGWVKRG